MNRSRQPDDYVVMGRIVAPYGVRGWVRVAPQTQTPDGLLAYRTWWVGRDADWREHKLIDGRVHGAALIAELEGIADRDRAAAMAGYDVAVPRAALPPAEEGEYYWCDLVGLTVINRQGETLGRVEEILATGANDVLVVRGERERLIPFVAAVVEGVELENSRLRVDWSSDY